MIICDFCNQYQEDGKCMFGLRIPKNMSCREYDPGLKKFCADPKDFASAHQLTQMAVYFGIKGMELKKIKLMALREENYLKIRLTEVPPPSPDSTSMKSDS
ncbi:MAG TPA: hypothetical protein VE262_03925 [Blastocatellia bacterium]|nr:hypothetical protein [Blastocatellia bacterium]